jgi:septal ring factor EnvC (AmiA/AmiB activator)
MDHEQLKGLVLLVLQTCDEDFARQALLALGHGYCQPKAESQHHPQAQVTSEQQDTAADDDDDRVAGLLQRVNEANRDAENERRRADQAESDCERHKQRLEGLEDEAESSRLRANAYATRLANDIAIMQESASQHQINATSFDHNADDVSKLLRDYGDEERL